MPGYTHMQRAMLSSVGLWASVLRGGAAGRLRRLATAYTLNDQSPLGSAAAYGVPLPLDRAYVARAARLRARRTTTSSRQQTRAAKVEAAVVQALALVMLDLSKFAQDVLLFTTSEYGFFSVPQELCTAAASCRRSATWRAGTGSRAGAYGHRAARADAATLAGLPSGYNMDYQETKAPFIEAIHLCRESLGVVRLFATGLEVDQERLWQPAALNCSPPTALWTWRSGRALPRRLCRRCHLDAAPEQVDLVARLRARAPRARPATLNWKAWPRASAPSRLPGKRAARTLSKHCCAGRRKRRSGRVIRMHLRSFQLEDYRRGCYALDTGRIGIKPIG